MAQTESARAEAFAGQADRSRSLAAGYVQQALENARVIQQMRARIEARLDAFSIPHRWNGSQLELLNPDGEWITGPSLRGNDGVSVLGAEIDGEGHLIVTLSNGLEIDAGDVVPNTGDVTGPESAVNSNFAAFDGTDGKGIKDSGLNAGSFATAAQGAKADSALQASALTPYAPLSSPALQGNPTAPTQSANDNSTKIANTAQVQSAIAAYVAAQDIEVLKGFINCSTNPNFPAADAGHVYRVSVAGKIGGASGINVEVNDRLECFVDGTAAGTQAAVGANWMISQVNIDGAVVGPASATDGAIVGYSGTSGKQIKQLTAAEVRAMLNGAQAIATNANVTLTVGTDAENIRHTGALSADRTVTLATAGAVAGARFRIVRTGSGAFNLNVGTGPLKALRQNAWADFVYDGSAWYLEAHGVVSTSVFIESLMSAVDQAAARSTLGAQATIVTNGVLSIPGSATGPAEIRLPEATGNGSNYVGLKAPASIAADCMWELPAADGINGQVLQTNGSKTLSFVTPGTGALFLLATTSVSAQAAVTFTAPFSTTFDEYEFELMGVTFSGAGSLSAQLSANAGSSFISSGYTGGRNRLNNSTGASTSYTDRIWFADFFNASSVINGRLRIAIESATMVSAYGVFHDVANNRVEIISQRNATLSSRLNGLRINPDAGTISAAGIRAYGVAK